MHCKNVMEILRGLEMSISHAESAISTNGVSIAPYRILSAGSTHLGAEFYGRFTQMRGLVEELRKMTLEEAYSLEQISFIPQ